MMPRCSTRTWTLAEIESAIARTLLDKTCPECPDMMSPSLMRIPSVIETIGPWTLSVGASDVIVTAPAICHAYSHRFVLRVNLWRKARTPIGGMRVKQKIVFKAATAPRPLRFI